MYRLRPSVRSLRAPARPTPRPSTSRSFWSSSSPSPSTFVASTSSAAADAAGSIPSVAPDLLPLLFGVVLANAASEDGEEERERGEWEVREGGGGEGVGAFAKRDVKMGELLIAERPLCVWPNGLSELQARQLFDQMTPAQQKVFMSLTDGGPETRGQLDEIRVRRACNGFSLPVPGVGGQGGGNMGFVFPRIASAPNATQVMNWTTLRLELYAITPVPAGREITIEYLPTLITLTHRERQSALKTSFGFSRCLCSACSAPPEEIARSDARRMEIKSLVGSLRAGRGDRKMTMGRMERIRVLCEEEGVRGLPDFGDESINSSFAVYKTLHARQQQEQRAAGAA
ncbi:hypothetical protein JCM10213_003212 [Rhodosporidiobolus nylandii]